MNVNIAVVASGPLIAGEIVTIIQSIISENINIQTYLTSEITGECPADLYVCAQTQMKSLLRVVARERIVLLDLMPNSKFFISISRIPVKEKVYIFNNFLEYTAILSDYCKKLGMNELEFIPIAYREMPLEEISARLKNARYIIGVDRFVGAGGLLSPSYRPYLRRDVTIIPAVRTASVHSACILIRRIAEKFHCHIADTIKKIKADLQSNPPLSAIDRQRLKSEADQLAIVSNHAMNIIQKAVTKSVLNNISADAAIFDAYDSSLDVDCLVNQPIDDSLAMIMEVNCTLGLIAEKLGSR